jgi:hypothetical protein
MTAGVGYVSTHQPWSRNALRREGLRYFQARQESLERLLATFLCLRNKGWGGQVTSR